MLPWSHFGSALGESGLRSWNWPVISCLLLTLGILKMAKIFFLPHSSATCLPACWDLQSHLKGLLWNVTTISSPALWAGIMIFPNSAVLNWDLGACYKLPILFQNNEAGEEEGICQSKRSQCSDIFYVGGKFLFFAQMLVGYSSPMIFGKDWRDKNGPRVLLDFAFPAGETTLELCFFPFWK